MSPEEIRELFSAAFEGDLEGDERSHFDAALEEDPFLMEEYRDFVETLQLMGRIAEQDEADAPDLLSGVQDRIRQRSRGRFYGDRFSQRAAPGLTLAMVMVMALALFVAVGWIALESSIVLDLGASQPTAPNTEPANP